MRIHNLSTVLTTMLTFATLSLQLSTAQAALCDLTTATNLSCSINGALFENTVNTDVVGTGVIDPFLSIQEKDLEEGFNTDAATLPLNTKRPTFTNALLVNQVGVVNKGGTDYLEFLLDTNEPNDVKKRLIKLVELRIYTGPAAAATATNLLGLTLIYDMDQGDPTNQVNLNDNFNNGSGKGTDLYIYVPKLAFASHETDNLVMYAKFGDTDPKDPLTADSGFEEFYVNRAHVPPPPCKPTDPACNPTDLPEPSVLTLMGATLLLAGTLGTRRLRR